MPQTTEKQPKFIDAEDFPDVMEAFDAVRRFPEFSAIASLNYKLIFRTKPRKSKGAFVLASISLVTERETMLHPYEVIIEICKESWESGKVNRKALLYHELCHLSVDENDTLTTVGHDFEDFHAVYKRFGDWKGDVERVSRAIAVNQLELQLNVEACN